MENLKWFIQDAGGNLLKDVQNAINGQNDGFANDNTLPDQILEFNSKQQAADLIKKHGWDMCKAIQIPYSVFIGDQEIAQFVDYQDAVLFRSHKKGAKVFLAALAEDAIN